MTVLTQKRRPGSLPMALIKDHETDRGAVPGAFDRISVDAAPETGRRSATRGEDRDRSRISEGTSAQPEPPGRRRCAARSGRSPGIHGPRDGEFGPHIGDSAMGGPARTAAQRDRATQVAAGEVRCLRWCRCMAERTSDQVLAQDPFVPGSWIVRSLGQRLLSAAALNTTGTTGSPCHARAILDGLDRCLTVSTVTRLASTSTVVSRGPLQHGW
jgi:hypothetical protein